jgi:hypothetical protein
MREVVVGVYLTSGGVVQVMAPDSTRVTLHGRPSIVTEFSSNWSLTKKGARALARVRLPPPARLT